MIATCPRCAWTGARLARGHKIPAHKRTPHQRVSCDGPTVDKAIASALVGAFAAAARLAPIPDRLLSRTAPADLWRDADLYLHAPAWARYVVAVLTPLSDVAGPHDRVTVRQYFADRTQAEAWARTCALQLGAPGVRADRAGYTSVSVLDRRMKRWERFRAMSAYERSQATMLESPITYTAIDPGGVVVRYTEPEHYPGYGETPSRDAYERMWP